MDLAALATNDNQTAYVAATVVFAATLPAAVILLRSFHALRGTTLVIPWAWALGSGALVATTCLFAALTPPSLRPSSFAAIQFVAACGTLCPLVALIGAKRPQHSAWSFVVLSLWGVLALPAAEVIFLQPGQRLEINAFRSWFLVGLLFAEVINFVATRYTIATLLLVSGQAIWLLDYLPLISRTLLPVWLIAQPEIAGLALVACSIVAAWLAASRQPVGGAYDRLWFDFRDSFGLFWALRLSERVSAVALQENWNFDLGWNGFRTKTDFAPLGELPTEIDRPLQHNLQGLLRRFVSPEWIAARLNRSTTAKE
ncbi:hypothetical protein [Anatilimnocola aggregata]|nr:hypothetical protein [Anatilimnocola aggregata]